jgi:hypothetical protein
MARHKLYQLTQAGVPVRVSPPGTHSGVDITIQNLGPNPVLIGGSDVTVENFGFFLPAGGAWSVELPPKDSLFVTTPVEDDTTDVAVLSVSLEHQN